MNKIPSNALSLKKFMLRCEVKKLFKQILKTIKEVPDKKSRSELREWARSDFKNNKNLTDELAIKMMMRHAQQALNELKTSLDLTK